MRLNHFIIWALCLGCMQTATAQKGLIAGVVLDKSSQSPLNGAMIRLTKPADAAFKKLAQTDEKGLFTFTGLPRF